MQAVIDLTGGRDSGTLDLAVCGVPLLQRVVLTAVRAGCTDVLVVLSSHSPVEPVQRQLERLALAAGQIRTVTMPEPLESDQTAYWSTVAPHIDDRFLWLPPNFLPHRAALAALLLEASTHPQRGVAFARPATPGPGGPFSGRRPAVLLKSEVLAGTGVPAQMVSPPVAAGVPVFGASDIGFAEAELVRHSGKVTDGIYSRFNRALCRPAVRWLSHTRVTPNAVTYGGLVVAVAAGVCFAKGTWALDVAGAALFFLSGLFDEADGMLARVRFVESPFGCWLETVVDYLTYLLIFAGMTIGAHRRHGSDFLFLGAALLMGCVLSFITIAIQRKLAAPASRPNEYSQRYLRALERDSANPISRAVRTLQFLLRKGVLIHHLLLFALLGLLPIVLVLGAFGANIAWIVTIYFNLRLFRRPSRTQLVTAEAAGAEVRK